MVVKMDGWSIVPNYPEGTTEEEKRFTEEHFKELYDAIISKTNDSTYDLMEYAHTEIQVSPLWILEAIKLCTRDVLEDDYELEDDVIDSVLNGEVVFGEEAPPEAHLANMGVNFVKAVCENLIEKELMPVLVLQALHNEWEKRSGKSGK